MLVMSSAWNEFYKSELESYDLWIMFYIQACCLNLIFFNFHHNCLDRKCIEPPWFLVCPHPFSDSISTILMKLSRECALQNKRTWTCDIKCCRNKKVHRWSVVGIKKYIVGLVIKTSSDAATLEREKVYVGKLNMILVQVFYILQCSLTSSLNTKIFKWSSTFVTI